MTLSPTASHCRLPVPFDRRLALVTAPPRPPGRWLVFCDRGGVGARITEVLTERGDDVIRVARHDAAAPAHRQTTADIAVSADAHGDFAALVEAADSPDRPLRGVVNLWLLDPLPFHLVPRGRPATGPLESLAHASGLLALTRALAAAAARPRLWLVTRGALPGDAGRPAPTQRMMWSLGQVLSVAHPELSPTLVELDPAGTLDEGAAAMTRVITADPRQRRLVTRRRAWFEASGAQAA